MTGGGKRKKYLQGISERGIITDWHGKIPKGMSKRRQEGRLGKVLEVTPRRRTARNQIGEKVRKESKNGMSGVTVRQEFPKGNQERK
jgi:hypothetical protein